MKTSPILHIVRLARRMNATAGAAEKDKNWSLIDLINDLKALADGGYKFILLAGILPTVAYLIASIKFFPAGVTLGDGFFFLMVGFAFGLTYMLLLIMGVGVALMLEPLFFGPAGIRKWIARIVVGAGLTAILVFLFFRDTAGGTLSGIGVIGFCGSGILVVILKRGLMEPPVAAPPGSPRPTPKPGAVSDEAKKWILVILWSTALLAPVLAAAPFLRRMNEDVVMTNVGLRSKNVTLKLSEENYNILTSAAGGQYLAALGCSTSSGAPERVVHGVNLLWHGIGERSLVEIPAGEGRPLVVELKRDGVFFFRNFSGVVTRCLEMSGDIFFKSGSPQLAEDDSGDLEEMMKVIHKHGASIEEIQVVGHADAFGYKGGAKSNNELALARATTIRDQIVERACFKNVKAGGHGAREPKTLCKDWPVKDTLSECLAVNRRVEVRMKFKPSKLVDRSTPERDPAIAGKPKS